MMVHYDFGFAELDLPSEFEDQSAYKFSRPEAGELLTVTHAVSPPGTRATQWLDDSLNRLRVAYEDHLQELTRETRAVPAGEAALALCRIALGSELHFGSAAVVSPDARCVLFSVMSDTNVGCAALTRLAVESVRLEPTDEVSAPGLARRAIGRGSIEVPEVWAVPTSFRLGLRSMSLTISRHPQMLFPEPRPQSLFPPPRYIDARARPTSVPRWTRIGGLAAITGRWVLSARVDGVEVRAGFGQLSIDLEPSALLLEARSADVDIPELERHFDAICARNAEEGVDG